MLYTVGQKANYEKAIIDNAPDPVLKTGRTQTYSGGIVFLTIDDAVAWRKLWEHENYAVWQLDTDEANTYIGLDGYRYLLNDAPIVPPSVA